MVSMLWLIPVLPLLGFVVLGALGLAGLRLPRALVSSVACGSVALAFALSVSCVATLAGMPEHHRQIVVTAADWIPPLGLSWSFLLDPLSSVMILVVTGVGLLIHIYSIGYMWEDEGYWRYFAYLNLFMAMMLTLVLGASLPLLFVGWEGVGLCSYLLIGFYYTKTDCADAGRKAFIVNRIGDALFVTGMLLAYVTFGNAFGIIEILQRGPDVAATSPGVVLAITLLLFGGACGKSAQLPLYVWLPDAMAGPTPVSALIHAATMVTAGVYMVCRMSPLYVLAPATLATIAAIGALTALMAALIAMAQDDIKKVLAYSTISQLGYMFLAAGVGAFGSAIFHLTTHAFFKALLFLGSGAVIHALHGEQDMQKMGGLRRHLPKTFLAFAAGWIAIAGVPLTSGFFSKDEILYKVFLSSPGLWAAGFVGAIMTAIYMTRLMSLTFLGPSRTHHERPHDAPPTMMIALGTLAVLSLTAGFGAGPLERWLEPVLAASPDTVVPRGAEPHEGPEMLLMILSSLAALGGIGLGYYLWVTRPGLPDRIASRLSGLYRAVKGKLYVDEFYDAVILQPFYALCRFLSGLDLKAVDGLVNGTGAALETSGHVLKLFHSGFVRNYALLYLVGAAAIVWYLVL